MRMVLMKMIEGLMFELAVTALKATRYAARTDIVSVPLTKWVAKNSIFVNNIQDNLKTQSFLSLVDQVAAGPQVVAMVVVVVVEIMAEETLEVHQVKSQFLVWRPSHCNSPKENQDQKHYQIFVPHPTPLYRLRLPGEKRPGLQNGPHTNSAPRPQGLP